jgi:hypothetical protein
MTTIQASAAITPACVRRLHTGVPVRSAGPNRCRMPNRTSTATAQSTTRSSPALVGDHAMPRPAKIGPNSPATA